MTCMVLPVVAAATGCLIGYGLGRRRAPGPESESTSGPPSKSKGDPTLETRPPGRKVKLRKYLDGPRTAERQ